MPASPPTSILRASVYQLLAELWGHELSLATIDSLSSPSVREHWIALGGGDPAPLSDQMDELSESYCRLFIGPSGHLPPLQSVWTDGELQSDVVSQLTEFTQLCDYDSPWPDLLADHLANELQMMSVILEKSTLETTTSSRAQAMEIADAFLTNHLSWTSQLLKQVVQTDKDGFYGRLAQVTQSFLNEETTTAPQV